MLSHEIANPRFRFRPTPPPLTELAHEVLIAERLRAERRWSHVELFEEGFDVCQEG